jgi:DUF438 domain-containing protein
VSLTAPLYRDHGASTQAALEIPEVYPWPWPPALPSGAPPRSHNEERKMSEWKDLLMRDHETTEKVFDAGEKALAAGEPDRAMVKQLLRYFVEYVDGCHNKKEENHLFPLLEQRGIPSQDGPLGVMLQEHTRSKELLAQLKPLADSYADGDDGVLHELSRVYAEYIALLKQHFWKENDILYPMAEKALNQSDADKVVEGIVATENALSPDTRSRYYQLADELVRWGEIKDLCHNLDHDTLGAILNTLPVELSFVDTNDTVRYFSHENLPKIFPRTRGAIGMQVQNCHPNKSVHLVNKILEDFKAGTRGVAEFWIDMGGKKIHIRYWPVRDAHGAYLGCLESVQDITDIQKLEGEKRL